MSLHSHYPHVSQQEPDRKDALVPDPHERYVRPRSDKSGVPIGERPS